MKKKYLPVGTVVLLKNGEKRLMITGFCCKEEGEGDNPMYDYSGCFFPEGFLRSTQVCLFNHEQIDTISHMGLVDEEEIEFKKKLNEILKN